MSNPTRLLFLCSGEGGTLRFAYSMMKERFLNIENISVISDRDCGAYRWALLNNLSTKLVKVEKTSQTELISACKNHQDAIIVTNIHKILTADFLSQVKNIKINVHYSILPAFKGTIGMKTLDNALEYGAKIVGATTHLVSEKVDSGRPLSQAVFCIHDKENKEIIVNNMFRAGCISLKNSLIRVQKGQNIVQDKNIIEINKKEFLVNPNYGVPDMLKTNEYWERLK